MDRDGEFHPFQDYLTSISIHPLHTETMLFLYQFTLQITCPLLLLTLLYHSFFFSRQHLIMDFSRLLNALACLFLDHIMQTNWIFNLKNVSSLDTQPLTRVTNSYLLLTNFTFLNMLF